MTRRAPAAILIALWLTPAVHAQTPEPPGERQPVGASFLATALSDLPSGATIFSILDTSVAELISDRVDAGGLTVAQAARMGAHGSSWTQTMFRIGAVDISDPRASGTPLLIPGILGWQRMDVATAAMPLDANAAGPAITLVPARPASSWSRSIEFFGAPAFLQSRRETTVPPAIARLDGWQSASVLLSGPIVPERAGVVFGASLANSTHFERADPTQLKDQLGSLDKVKRLIKTYGMVNCTDEFLDQPKVINGFSELMKDVFGDDGVGARSAVGHNSLPGNIAVEVECIFEIEG